MMSNIKNDELFSESFESKAVRLEDEFKKTQQYMMGLDQLVYNLIKRNLFCVLVK